MYPEMEPDIRNLEAEQAVLGAVFLDPDSLDKIDFLEERDFSYQSHEFIMNAMRKLRERKEPVDLITVTNRLQKFGRLIDIGNVSYLAELENSAPTASNIVWYARMVRTAAHKRRIAALGKRLIGLSQEEFESDEDLFCSVDDEVMEIKPKTTSKMKSFAEMQVSYFKHLKSKATKLLTGFTDFDEWSQLWLGWLYILAGRPSVGKTAKALQIAYGVASLNKDVGCVLIYSQEMDEDEVIDRMVSNVAGVNYTRMINKGDDGRFRDTEWTKITEAYEKVKKLKIFVQDSSGVTIDEIESTARTMEKEHGKVSCILVDYLQIMGINEKKGESRSSAIGRVTRRAKNIARNRKCVVIMLSQFDRAVDDGEPKMKHLKESGSIEQDADVVDAMYDTGEREGGIKIIDSIFLKGRNVGLARFKYRFEWWYQRFVPYKKKDDAS